MLEFDWNYSKGLDKLPLKLHLPMYIEIHTSNLEIISGLFANHYCLFMYFITKVREDMVFVQK